MIFPVMNKKARLNQRVSRGDVKASEATGVAVEDTRRSREGSSSAQTAKPESQTRDGPVDEAKDVNEIRRRKNTGRGCKKITTHGTSGGTTVIEACVEAEYKFDAAKKK